MKSYTVIQTYIAISNETPLDQERKDRGKRERTNISTSQPCVRRFISALHMLGTTMDKSAPGKGFSLTTKETGIKITEYLFKNNISDND